MELTTRTIAARKHIALVAHDHRKQALLEWVEPQDHSGAASTVRHRHHRQSDPARQRHSGHQHAEWPNGRRPTGRRIDCRRQDRHADLLWDPLNAVPHDPDVKALLRLATVWNIPVATNRSTADFLIDSPLFKSEVEIAIPDYQRYLQERLK